LLQKLRELYLVVESATESNLRKPISVAQVVLQLAPELILENQSSCIGVDGRVAGAERTLELHT